MEVKGDIMFPGGKYMKNGEEKTRWIRCGTLLQNAEGNLRIKLDSIPVGIAPDGGWFSVFEKKPRQQPGDQGYDAREDLDW